MHKPATSSPVTRFCELLFVAFFHFIFVTYPVFIYPIVFYLLFTPLAPLVIAYFIWFWYDLKQPAKGSRIVPWVRRLWIYKYFAGYFSLQLVKTADLDPSRNYILGSHPHGLFSCGAIGNIALDVNNFSELFPGMERYLVTLTGQFHFPLRREYMMALGCVESSHKSIEYLLSNPEKKGQMVAIVLGGAEEVLDAHCGKYDLNLKSRRGFCHYALKYGADLVPVFHFGENDLFIQCPNPRGSPLRKLQSVIKKKMGICAPPVSGASLFPGRSSGPLPMRKPITTVVGAPVRVEQKDDPSDEDVTELHEKYCAALTELFEKHKKAYGVPDEVKLNIF
uniref:Acyltransferase n=1 Tax=Steinernema glaseri TaxID=37863 RepID=A0A1I8AE39_9BILA